MMEFKLGKQAAIAVGALILIILLLAYPVIFGPTAPKNATINQTANITLGNETGNASAEANLTANETGNFTGNATGNGTMPPENATANQTIPGNATNQTNGGGHDNDGGTVPKCSGLNCSACKNESACTEAVPCVWDTGSSVCARPEGNFPALDESDFMVVDDSVPNLLTEVGIGEMPEPKE